MTGRPAAGRARIMRRTATRDQAGLGQVARVERRAIPVGSPGLLMLRGARAARGGLRAPLLVVRSRVGSLASASASALMSAPVAPPVVCWRDDAPPAVARREAPPLADPVRFELGGAPLCERRAVRGGSDRPGVAPARAPFSPVVVPPPRGVGAAVPVVPPA